MNFNPSLKVLLPFDNEYDTTVAFNLSLGIKLSDAFTLRPEYEFVDYKEELKNENKYLIDFV